MHIKKSLPELQQIHIYVDSVLQGPKMTSQPLDSLRKTSYLSFNVGKCWCILVSDYILFNVLSMSSWWSCHSDRCWLFQFNLAPRPHTTPVKCTSGTLQGQQQHSKVARQWTAHAMKALPFVAEAQVVPPARGATGSLGGILWWQTRRGWGGPKSISHIGKLLRNTLNHSHLRLLKA